MEPITQTPPETSIAELWLKIEEFGRTTYELSKLKMVDTAADITSMLVARAISIFVLVLFIFLLDVGVALWLGETLGKFYYGFFVVAGFNAIVGVILLLFLDKWIKKPVTKIIITEALK
jgi:hypothetical protein